MCQNQMLRQSLNELKTAEPDKDRRKTGRAERMCITRALHSCMVLELLKKFHYAKQIHTFMVEQYLPIAPIASRRSASCTIANSRVGSALSLFETSFLNPAVNIADVTL